MTRTSEPHLTQQQVPRKPKKTREELKQERRVRRTLKPPAPYSLPTVDLPIAPLKIRKKHKPRIYKKAPITSTPQRIRMHRRQKSIIKGLVKKCTHCHLTLAITDFDLQSDSSHPVHQRRPYCYLCRKKKNALAYQKRKRK